MAAGSSLDTKLIGLLAFYAALIAPVLPVLTGISGLSDGLRAGLWVMLAFLVVSIVLCVAGLFGPDDILAGPVPREFYDRYGGHERREFLEQLASDLDEAVRANRKALGERGRAVTGSMVLFGAGLLVAGVIGVVVSVLQ